MEVEMEEGNPSNMTEAFMLCIALPGNTSKCSCSREDIIIQLGRKSRNKTNGNTKLNIYISELVLTVLLVRMTLITRLSQLEFKVIEPTYHPGLSPGNVHRCFFKNFILKYTRAETFRLKFSSKIKNCFRVSYN